MTWHRVCRRSDLPADRGYPVILDGRPLALFAQGEEVLAVDNVCRHVGSPLDDGFVADGCVTCPWHGWRYDLRTGEQMTLFGRRPGLGSYPVALTGEEVLVWLG